MNFLFYIYTITILSNSDSFANDPRHKNDKIELKNFLDRIYFYSMAAHGFFDYGEATNEEIIFVNKGEDRPKPFYIREENERGGLSFSIDDYDQDSKKLHQVLDLSRSNNKLISYQYHGGANQIFYLLGLNSKNYKIQIENDCVFYDDENYQFIRRECAKGEENEKYLFKIYSDHDIDLFYNKEMACENHKDNSYNNCLCPDKSEKNFDDDFRNKDREYDNYREYDNWDRKNYDNYREDNNRNRRNYNARREDDHRERYNYRDDYEREYDDRERNEDFNNRKKRFRGNLLDTQKSDYNFDEMNLKKEKPSNKNNIFPKNNLCTKKNDSTNKLEKAKKNKQSSNLKSICSDVLEGMSTDPLCEDDEIRCKIMEISQLSPVPMHF